MAYEYITLGWGEFINPSRTAAYLKRFHPQLEFKGTSIPDIGSFFHGSAYQTPPSDPAPWYDSANEDSRDFYGGIPSDIKGLRDSTQTVAVTELMGDGAVPGLRRNASREIRIQMTIFGRTERAVHYGIDWYVAALSGGYCPTVDVQYCQGETLEFMHIVNNAEAMRRGARRIYDVKTLQGVKVVDTINFRSVKAKVIEFILIAGNPFIYLTGHESMTMIDEGDFSTTRSEVKCNPESQAYDQLVTDPAQGSLLRPPRPPMVSPVQMPSSWRTAERTMPWSELRGQPGQLVFGVMVQTDTVRRLLRLRLYRMGDTASCNYRGEFLITYMPANSSLYIDGISKQIHLTQGGDTVPAGNLVIGSDGRPATWPEVDCRNSVIVRADYPTVPSGQLDIFVETIRRR